MPKRGPSEHYALNENEINRLWGVCLELVDKVLVGLMMFCGLRIGEAVHLNSSWLKEGEIHIPARMPCNCWECSKRKGDNKGFWKPKTRAGVRIIPVASPLLPYLTEYLRYQPDGLPFNRTSGWSRIKKLAKEAKLNTKVFPHSLRATAATVIARAGTSAIALAYIMAWKNIGVASHYVQVAQAQKEAAEAMRKSFR